MRVMLPALLFAVTAASPAAAQPQTLSTLEWEISANPPGTAPSELQRALASKNYERAERLLADAIARQPASRQLLTQIASVFMMDRKPLNAAIALKKAEALGALDNQERLQLALAYIAMKRGDWARSELDRLALAEPGNVIYSLLAGAAGLRCRSIRLGDSPAEGCRRPGAGICQSARQPGPLLRSPPPTDEAMRHYREAVRLNRDAENQPAGPRSISGSCSARAATSTKPRACFENR